MKFQFRLDVNANWEKIYSDCAATYQKFANSMATGGVEMSAFSNVADCQNGCALDSNCAGIGWISSKCQFFTLTNLFTLTVGTSLGNDIYQLLNRTGSACPGGKNSLCKFQLKTCLLSVAPAISVTLNELNMCFQINVQERTQLCWTILALMVFTSQVCLLWVHVRATVH